MAKPGGANKRKAPAERREAQAKLEAFGNKFMEMFDDYDADAAVRQATAGADSSSEDSPTSEGADERSHGPSSWRDRWDAEFADTKAEPGGMSQAAGTSRAAPGGGNRSQVVQFRDPAQRGAITSEQQRLARKRFMSCKIDKVHMDVEVPLAPAPADEEPDMLSREALDQMRREVEELGATALDKKSRKDYERRKLEEIGAKPEKGPRIAAMIGKGMAKKQVERGAKALEEAINAGLVQRKGSGKLRKSLVPGSKPRKGKGGGGAGGGLNEKLGGHFKDGVLHVGKVAKVDKKRAAKRQQAALKGGKF